MKSSGRVPCEENRRRLAFSLIGTLVATLAIVSLAPPAVATTAHVLTLDGNGSLIIGNEPALNPTGGITIEAWVRPTADEFPYAIVDKNFQDGYWLGLTTQSRIRYYANGPPFRDGNRRLPLARWSHVAVSYDGATVRGYVDGALDFESPLVGTLPVTDTHIGIGARASDGAFNFVGQMAEVRIWDEARSQVQIRRDIVRQFTENEDGLIAAFNLDGGADEIEGRFRPIAVGGASFGSTFAAPPTLFDPVRIPRIPGPVVTDGACLDSEWGGFRVPMWYDDTSEPAWVRVGATSLRLHVCFDGVPFSENSFLSEAAVHLDRHVDGGSDPDTDDVRFVVDEEGATRYRTGSDAGSGWDSDWIVANTVDAAAGNAGDFVWDAEFSISRLMLSAEFNVLFVHDNNLGGTGVMEWPRGMNELLPFTWIDATIDDTTAPRPDSRSPTARIGSISVEVISDSTLRIVVDHFAEDDVDIASIEVYVDGMLDQTCTYVGEDDVEPAPCEYDEELPPGLYHFRAVARDHLGRIGSSPAEIVRLTNRRQAPTVELSFDPPNPDFGETVTVTATARDVGVIDSVRISTSVRPFGKTCDGGGSNEVVCEMQVPAPALRYWFQVRAEAIDDSELRGSAGPRYVIYGDSLADSDGDGLPDDVELGMCTDPDDPDTDKDSLVDGWEVMGLFIPSGGSVDLPALGADPCVKDIFVQYDYERGAKWSDRVVPQLTAKLLSHGINLHVEENVRPRPPGDPVSPLNSLRAAYQQTGGDWWFPPARNWTHRYAYSPHVSGRSGNWGHYFTFRIYTSEDCECPLDQVDPQRNCNASMGCPRMAVARQTRTAMHELGHSIGLGHGGQVGNPVATFREGYFFYDNIAWNNQNHKPNQLGVMNYSNAMGLLCVSDPGSSGARNWIAQLDFSDGSLPTLDENDLDERPDSAIARAIRAKTCTGSFVNPRPVLSYTCIDPRLEARGDDPGSRVRVVHDGTSVVARQIAGGSWEFDPPGYPAAGIDWNCDGVIQDSVTGSINGAGDDRSLPGESSCDGVDNDDDDLIDEGCNWIDGEILAASDDWDRIPRSTECLSLYSTRDGADCHVFPPAYRLAMAASGNDLDCRALNHPTLDDKICEGYEGPFFAPPIEIDDGFTGEPIPGLESCNEFDDDGDGEVDEGCADGDEDGVVDEMDNCPKTPNPVQADSDGDYIGDACEAVGPVKKLVVESTPKGNALTWGTGGGEGRGVRIYREDPESGLLTHLGDTKGEAWLDLPPKEDAEYIVVPLDMKGAEYLASTVRTAVPEPGPGVTALAALVTLVAVRHARSRAR